jgi:hypothetical protein
MNKRIFDAFDARKAQVQDYMAGCAMKYGMACTCGPGCRCKNCPIHQNNQDSGMIKIPENKQTIPSTVSGVTRFSSSSQMNPNAEYYQPGTLTALEEDTLHVDQPMNFFGMAPPPGVDPSLMNNASSNRSGSARRSNVSDSDSSMRMSFYGQDSNMNSFSSSNVIVSNINMSTSGTSNSNNNNNAGNAYNPMGGGRSSYRNSQRNPSIISYGNPLRGMSLTSETTFGRAMSGLSALSIDWENLEDFDLDVDHSDHINQLNAPMKNDSFSKRSSLRRSTQSGSDSSEAHVSFKV